ncbi:MAG: aminoacyl-histidine dipeptidase [Planctomycetaceae bacterium]|nr:aminoacyl-histidine dipeptidase [Planctomycetaceae bacterium]
MSSPLASLQPSVLWKHFDALRCIPRPSGHEQAVMAHLRAWAESRGFKHRSDGVGNLVIYVPATKGREKAATVVLQNHVDMVAEKDKSTEFDFLKDPIEVVVDGDWVVAPKTTLGADNGIGVVAAQAVVDEPSVSHGPLELVFTVEEESALTGANNIDGSLIAGRTLLNLDSEEDGTLFVGCAGGCTADLAFELNPSATPQGWTELEITVTGLKGGHSGLTIHENRGNAIKVLVELLSRVAAGGPARLVRIEGGNKHNAIPREATAVVALPANSAGAVGDLAAAVTSDTLTEIGAIDPGLRIVVRPVDGQGPSASEATTVRLVRLLQALPHGALVMSRDIAGLVETSSNLAVVATADGRVEITTSTRSSVAPALRKVLDQIRAVAELSGASISERDGYPGWQPNMASPLLALCRTAWKELHGAEAHVTAVHAGLECGIINERIGGGADMISFGPWLEGVHAPGEKVNWKTVQRFFGFLSAILDRLSR